MTSWSRRDRQARAAARRHVPFVGHAFVEYALAAALFVLAAEQRGSVGLVCVVFGGLIGGLALVTRARLGVFHLISLRTHHALDIALALLAASTPAYARGVIHLPGIIAAEVLAAVLLWIERLTLYVDRPRRARVAPSSAARPTASSELGTRAAELAQHGARQLGTATGVARRLIRQRAARRAEH